jgi:hypothetical protein
LVLYGYFFGGKVVVEKKQLKKFSKWRCHFENLRASLKIGLDRARDLRDRERHILQ